MNGVYQDTLRVAIWTVEVDGNDQVEILVKKKAELASDNEFHIHVHSRKNKAALYLRCSRVWGATEVKETDLRPQKQDEKSGSSQRAITLRKTTRRRNRN